MFLSKSRLEKATKNDGHLVRVQKTVNRGGKMFQEYYYVKPEDAKKKFLKPGSVHQIHDKEGIGKEHRGKHFTITGPHEEKGKHNVKYEDGSTGVVHEKHILDHAQPVDGKKRLPAQKEEGPKPRQWVHHLPHLPEDTQSYYKVNGEYTPERKVLHASVISKFTDHVLPVAPGGQKIAILMAGGPAAGKSTVLRHMMTDDMASQFVNVNPDDCKAALPEYQEAVAGSARNAAMLCHEESSDIAAAVRNHAIETGKHIIIDGTMKSIDKYRKLIDNLKDKGYKIHMIHVDIDVDQAKHFASKRAEKSGRWVPMDMLESAYPAVRKSFLGLKDHADDFIVFDRRRGEPEKVWSKSDGILNHEAVQNIYGGGR